VAKCIWSYVSEFLGYEIGIDYIFVASKWLSKEKFYVTNSIACSSCTKGCVADRQETILSLIIRFGPM
jgi:hypothetical protein